MNKRITFAVLAFLLSLCVFAGCQPTSDVGPAYPAESVFAESNTGTNSEATSDPNIPTVEETDFFTENGQAVLPASAVLPTVCTETDTPHLYFFPIELPQADGFSVHTNGSVLQLFYWQEESRCSLFSLETGELIRELRLPAGSVHGQLADGGLWVAEFPTLQITFYDREGNGRTVREPSEQNPDNRTPQDALVSTNGKYLLVTYSEGDPLILFDLESGKQTVPSIPKNTVFWKMEETADGFLLAASDSSLVLLNPVSGETKTYFPDREIVSCYGELFSYSTDGRLLLGTAETASERFYMELESSEMLSDLAFGHAVTQTYDETAVRFYNLRNGKFLSKVSFTSDVYGIHADLLDSGAVFLLKSTPSGTSVYLYDLPTVSAEESGTPVETLLCTEEELKEEVARIAEETEEKTGVDLLYASEGNDFSMFDYVGAAELDLYTVYHSVNTVSDILSRYPDGMLRESYENTHKGLRIYLCGTLYGVSGNSLSLAGGVTSESDGYILVALDVHNNLSYDLPHELSHVFDRRIAYADSEEGSDWFAVWENATPIENAYANTYDNYLENRRYTRLYEQNESDIWFVDEYARTFPTEDRARIMEYLFNPKADGLSDALQYENLKEKARLYCDILRACFPSCDTGETLYWEIHLEANDERVIS